MLRMRDFGRTCLLTITILVSFWPEMIPGAMAADYTLVGIESVFNDPPRSEPIQPYAIVVTSSTRRFDSLPRNTRSALGAYFVYQTKVQVSGEIYYRLALGNFDTENAAKSALERLKPTFLDAWIYQRSNAERLQLGAFSNNLAPGEKLDKTDAIAESADRALDKARQKFIDEDFAAVIAITDRVARSGNPEQVQAALELAGAARERQGRFAQAEVLYRALLDTDPPPETATRVANRLEGIRTMAIDPKDRLPRGVNRVDDERWRVRGVLHQYYRDDTIEQTEQGADKVYQAFVTDIGLTLERRRDADTLAFRVDAGLVMDLLRDSNDTRVSEANLSYARDEFRIIGGRQWRTVTGVQGRFDGFTFRDLSRSGFQISYFLGNLAQSSYDGFGSDNPLFGANLDFSPYEWLEVNLYGINQEVSGLTDRQAIGTEFQFLGEAGFIYGIVDYDVFYQDLNNISLISNYRRGPRWTFNLSLGRLNAPTLATTAALQGQAATTIEALKAQFSSDEIYQLAQDRSSKSTTLYFGTTYRLDDERQLNFDFSSFDLDATRASGGVDALPATSDRQFSLDYSVRNLFSMNDYTSLGVGIADTNNTEILSLRLRSRFAGAGELVYDPRLRLDFRSSASTGVDQIILRPSLKLRYRAKRNLDLEADFGFEYSDLDLPDYDKQLAYSWFIGYAYFF